MVDPHNTTHFGLNLNAGPRVKRTDRGVPPTLNSGVPATRNWPFSVLGLWDKLPGFAPALCHIAGIFQPLPGSRHFKQKIGRFVSRG